MHKTRWTGFDRIRIMSELSRDTDLDTLDGVEMVLSRNEIERLGILRTDLKALMKYTSCDDLGSALETINAGRVLEIGTADRFEALISVYRALESQNPKFLPTDIWAVDPELSDGVYLDQQKIVSKITKRREEAQNLISEITGKFDLVLAKGVISIGAGITMKPADVIDEILSIIKQSLNPQNKDAVAIISSKIGILLPFNREILNNAGLKPVFFMSPTRKDEHWEEILSKEGQIDQDPFKLVICQRDK